MTDKKDEIFELNIDGFHRYCLAHKKKGDNLVAMFADIIPEELDEELTLILLESLKKRVAKNKDLKEKTSENVKQALKWRDEDAKYREENEDK